MLEHTKWLDQGIITAIMSVRIAVMQCFVGLTESGQSKIMLVPIRIYEWQSANIIQLGQFILCQRQGHGFKILFELSLCQKLERSLLYQCVDILLLDQAKSIL